MISLSVFPIAKSWIAGTSMGDAINYCKFANAKGARVVLNYLGEELKSRKEFQRSQEEYSHVLGILNRCRINGCISVN